MRQQRNPVLGCISLFALSLGLVVGGGFVYKWLTDKEFSDTVGVVALIGIGVILGLGSFYAPGNSADDRNRQSSGRSRSNKLQIHHTARHSELVLTARSPSIASVDSRFSGDRHSNAGYAGNANRIRRRRKFSFGSIRRDDVSISKGHSR